MACCSACEEKSSSGVGCACGVGAGGCAGSVGCGCKQNASASSPPTTSDLLLAIENPTVVDLQTPVMLADGPVSITTTQLEAAHDALLNGTSPRSLAERVARDVMLAAHDANTRASVEYEATRGDEGSILLSTAIDNADLAMRRHLARYVTDLIVGGDTEAIAAARGVFERAARESDVGTDADARLLRDYLAVRGIW